jgi:hypothetical protein
MGSEEPKFLGLRQNSWPIEERVSAEENERLALSFVMEELEEVLKSTKTATAPRLDGFPVAFYKKILGPAQGGGVADPEWFCLGEIGHL